jgi:hypothetical protein
MSAAAIYLDPFNKHSMIWNVPSSFDENDAYIKATIGKPNMSVKMLVVYNVEIGYKLDIGVYFCASCDHCDGCVISLKSREFVFSGPLLIVKRCQDSNDVTSFKFHEIDWIMNNTIWALSKTIKDIKAAHRQQRDNHKILNLYNLYNL